jgi:hypothetical protein
MIGAMMTHAPLRRRGQEASSTGRRLVTPPPNSRLGRNAEAIDTGSAAAQPPSYLAGAEAHLGDR